MALGMIEISLRHRPSGDTAKSDLDAAAQKRLVTALVQHGLVADRSRVKLLETHISYVLLTGEFAYKIKKAVNLGFLDFTTLPARRFYCEEELRLNRRLAPSLYLDVVPITGKLEAPLIGGEGPVLEYAVKLREFPQQALASEVLARDELKASDIDALASAVAVFHRTIGVVRLGTSFGMPDEVLRIARQNFTQIRPLLDCTAGSADLDVLEAWTERDYAARATIMLRRRQEGFVRECHGDLHLGNIALIGGKPVIFDGIEFSEAMRWIDVMSEVAFTVMDLEDRGRADFAYRFLSAYLEITGDYDGLSVLCFYLVYRALVRAKIARLRAAQCGETGAKASARDEYAGYVKLARRNAESPQPAILITHGLSGCGKTTVSQALVEITRGVRVRTDVERKRIAGDASQRDEAEVEAGLYTLQATERTYGGVLAFARSAVRAGYVSIIDAAFLKRWQRDMFRKLAAEFRVPFVIVSLEADAAILRKRIEQRRKTENDASDANLAVLDFQLRTQEPLASDELADVVAWDAEAPLSEARSPAHWQGVLQRLGRDDRA